MPANVAYKTLYGTMFEKDSNVNRQLPDDPIDIQKTIEEGTESNNKEG